ncbi:MAG: hypothetical protein Q4F28_00325 [Eubacteriales bacterium]|nr:hypothetical protein [Eubacteriales bacterium]
MKKRIAALVVSILAGFLVDMLGCRMGIHCGSIAAAVVLYLLIIKDCS